jgi:beta-lactamase superfamily II metal-dependent hydrolase
MPCPARLPARRFVRPALGFAWALLLAAPGLAAAPAAAGHPLPAWSEGHLEIHHINTGKGESTFLILPDGTTLLIDAGAAPTTPPWGVPARPDASRAPGEWIARYIRHRLAPAPRVRVDYALLSHFHWDHMGAIDARSKKSATGDYLLGGITEVAEHVPFGKVVDRNWPDYNWPEPLTDAKMQNYRRFLAWQSAHRGLRVERFQVGRDDQFPLLHQPAKYPDFQIRNLAANGRVWTGVGHGERDHFPPLASLPAGSPPSENKCSIAVRISYGKFDYFTGGDLDVRDVEFETPGEQWKDIERPVALATGPVEAMKANHHANYDANSSFFLSVLRPQAIVAATWGASQPSMNVYRRMLSPAVYPGPRELFFTNLLAATLAAIHVDRARTEPGHIVLRVPPGGATFQVYSLDDSNEEFRVKATYGPYSCR